MNNRIKKNTALARKLAQLYKEFHGETFPGGETNAYIHRHYPGYHLRSQDAWSWQLMPIHTYPNMPTVQDTGSPYPATEVAKDPSLLEGEAADFSGKQFRWDQKYATQDIGSIRPPNYRAKG